MDEFILQNDEESDSDEDLDLENEPGTGDEEVDTEHEEPPRKKRDGGENGPQRRSARLALKPENKQRQLLRGAGLVRGEKLWREMEKKSFLDVCKAHGTKNVERIIEELPSKAPGTVRALIQRQKKFQNYTIETKFVEEDGEAVVLDDGESGRRRVAGGPTDLPSVTPRGRIVEVTRRRRRDAPIEMWIDVAERRVEEQARRNRADGSSLSPDYSSIVPTLLQWISEYETHPSVEECGGVDYAAIYHYLACLCQGEAPPDLNLETSNRVRRLLPTLVRVLQQHDLDKETDYLENYRGPQTKYRCEESFDGNSPAATNITELSRVPGINPLAFHPEMFTSKEIPKLDDLIRISSEEVMEDL